MNPQRGAAPELDLPSFEVIAAFAKNQIGIQLPQTKRLMIQSRLRHRIKALNLSSFRAYVRLLSSEAGPVEQRNLISALTTNVSNFFREPHHFDHLKECLAAMQLSGARPDTPIRTWSAGCSFGQEPFSIALAALAENPHVSSETFKILATDVDPIAIAFANAARFDRKMMGDLPKSLISKYFRSVKEANGEVFLPDADLRRFVTFREMNLFANWPMKFKFDFIFCRNVVIYFDLATQQQLWPRFAKALKPGGYLYLGHSERISDPRSFGLEICGPTIYRKCQA